MIYCDHHIEKAIDFRAWNSALRVPASSHRIDLDNIQISDLLDLTTSLQSTDSGTIIIEPGAFVLVRTLESVSLPLKSKLAARVEGRSRQARLGMGVHITAPTIHAGFSGKITLEIVNHGPFHLEVRPNRSKLCFRVGQFDWRRSRHETPTRELARARFASFDHAKKTTLAEWASHSARVDLTLRVRKTSRGA